MAECFIEKYCENIIAISSILKGKRALQVGTPNAWSCHFGIPFLNQYHLIETNLMQHWWDQQNHLIGGGGGRDNKKKYNHHK
jgi:hypothetical protein